MKKTFLVVLAAVMCLIGAGAAMAVPPVWTPGVLSNTEDLVGVRYRNFGDIAGAEVYLGIPDLGLPANRTETDLTWVETNQITFTYDNTLDKLITEVFNSTGSSIIEFTDVSATVAALHQGFTPDTLNFLQITIVNSDMNTTVNFNDVFLFNDDFAKGASLGSFGGNGRYDWSVKDFVFSQGFTITGTVHLLGTFGSDPAKSFLEIKAGHWTANQPPDCSMAKPSIKKLWPPNHQWTKIKVLGVTDPDDDPVTIVIDSIFQDEPVNGSGDGNTSPDGKGIGSSAASVRSERQGSGNGRVYHISFTANDGNGGTCSGEVTVGVPKSQGKKGGPVDDGALYDSTSP